MMAMFGMGGFADMQTLLNAVIRQQPGNSNQRSDAQQVCIKGLPGDCTDFDLYKLCSPYGPIAPRGVKAMLNPEGMCTGTGWVDFVDDKAAAFAVQSLNNFMLPNGTMLWLRTKQSRPMPQA